MASKSHRLPRSAYAQIFLTHSNGCSAPEPKHISLGDDEETGLAKHFGGHKFDDVDEPVGVQALLIKFSSVSRQRRANILIQSATPSQSMGVLEYCFIVFDSMAATITDHSVW